MRYGGYVTPAPVVQLNTTVKVRDWIWLWLHNNMLRGMIGQGLRVRARADFGGIKVWTDFHRQKDTLEFLIPYGSDLTEEVEKIKATYALLEG